jgi:isopentenyl-diphosphate Delta-isomerase
MARLDTQNNPQHYVPAKDAHIEACLTQSVESTRSSGLETMDLKPGFPDFHRGEMDTACVFAGKTLSLPLLISPITGGGRLSRKININLAKAAQRLGIAMAVGSQRPMLEGKAPPDSYLVREFAPSIPLLANLGLVHVRLGREYLLKAVETIGADGITLYVNPLHEILQADGEEDFAGILTILESILDDFSYPVFLKEVGFGMSDSVVAWAEGQKIQGVDVAGLGGTNWARIEGIVQGKDYAVYESLGRRTKEAVESARMALRSDQQVIASGGIRTGVDMAKAFALGADLVGMALPFLKWAVKSADEVVSGVDRLKEELKVAMWFAGARTPKKLYGKIDRPL